MAAKITIPSQKRQLLLALLLLLGFSLYANSALNGFVFDDHSQIERNPWVHSFKYTGKLFATSLAAQQGEQATPNYYRPLQNLGFLICYKLFGSSPFGFHLLNIFVNCLVVWLVFLVGSELFSNEWLGLVAAILFALHPIHTEPVAWIDGISDPELAAFWLLSFFLFLRLGAPAAERSAWLQPGMLATFVLALLIKEPAMTFPVLVTAYEHFYREDRHQTRWTIKLQRYAGFWIVLFAYLAMRAASVGRLTPANARTDVSTQQVLFSALALIGQYAKKLLWPSPLIAFYSFQRSEHWREPQVLLGFAVVLVLAAAFVLLWKRSRLYSFALFWMCLPIAPTLNVRWMSASVFAERYLYLPTVAFSWLLAGGLLWMWGRAEAHGRPLPGRPLLGRLFHGRRSLQWAMVAAGAALAVACTYAIVKRNREWRSDFALVEASLAAQPDSAHMHVQYGLFKWAAGDHDAAESEWQLALHYNPESVEALTSLGLARIEEGRYNEAAPFLQQAIALKPRFATPHIYLGRMYAAEGKDDLAEAEFLKALEIHPRNTEALNALGDFYLQRARLAEAAQQFRASVEIYSDLQPWSSLGEIYDRTNQPEKAREAWDQVLTFELLNPHAHRSLGLIYLANRQWEQAQKSSKCACSWTTKTPSRLPHSKQSKPTPLHPLPGHSNPPSKASLCYFHR